MTTFYGENTPSATPAYTDFAIDHIKKRTLPTVNPWVCHVSNTWQNSENLTKSENTEEICKDWQMSNEVRLVADGSGKVKFELVSAPASHEIAFIDWISFSFKRYTFVDSYIDVKEDHVEDICVYKTGEKLNDIFGFKVGKKRKNGKNFYEKCYEIVTESGVVVGDLCIGGQNNSILIMLSGQGCLMGDYGWQEGLYKFLKGANGAKITRLDLAHDDLEGNYLDIDDLNERESEGQFYYFGKPARVTWWGDWKYLDRENLGRTLQIGCRTSDKMLRAYQKGKQLGDKSSAWVRLEVELKAKHTIIPFDAVIKPSDYFINLYPCFKDIFQYEDQAQSRIEYVKRTVQITIDKGIEIFNHQFGSWLGFFKNWFDDDEVLFNALSKDKGVPKRFELSRHDWSRILVQG
jgi:phage replication initiation protein